MPRQGGLGLWPSKEPREDLFASQASLKRDPELPPMGAGVTVESAIRIAYR